MCLVNRVIWCSRCLRRNIVHYGDLIMGAMASQITSLTIDYSSVYSGADYRKHQSSTSLAFVWGIHRWPVNSPLKRPITRKMFPFDDVIMLGLELFYHEPYNSCRSKFIFGSIKYIAISQRRWEVTQVYIYVKYFLEEDKDTIMLYIQCHRHLWLFRFHYQQGRIKWHLTWLQQFK